MENEYKTNYRWTILGLLFAATTVNYLNRIVLSVLLPEIEKDIGLNSIQYGNILAAFQFTYTIGFLLIGNVVDRLGTKLSFIISIILYSFAGAMHALCGTVFCLAAWRGVFGISASANFPAAIKSVSEWFQVKDRALATALFNSGASISQIIGPPLIALIALSAGWKITFVVFGAFGIVLVVLFQLFYKKPTQSFEIKETVTQVGWKVLLKHKQAYGIMAGKFLTDPVWWFYLYWMPKYLNDSRGFDLKGIAVAIPVIYTLATLMGIIGGWAPKKLMSIGWDVNRARKATMLASAALFPFTIISVFAGNPWVAILLVSVACGAHNTWSANIFTLSSDCFPSKAVGSMTGLGGFAGGLGGIFFSALIPGFLIQTVGYAPVFILMGVMHPLAFLLLNFFIKKVEQVNI
jgi:MFS transporter, ACS family, hexuronate transporter